METDRSSVSGSGGGGGSGGSSLRTCSWAAPPPVDPLSVPISCSTAFMHAQLLPQTQHIGKSAGISSIAISVRILRYSDDLWHRLRGTRSQAGWLCSIPSTAVLVLAGRWFRYRRCINGGSAALVTHEREREPLGAQPPPIRDRRSARAQEAAENFMRFQYVHEKRVGCETHAHRIFAAELLHRSLAGIASRRTALAFAALAEEESRRICWRRRNNAC